MKKHLAFGTGVVAVLISAFLAAHRPLSAPAGEESATPAAKNAPPAMPWLPHGSEKNSVEAAEATAQPGKAPLTRAEFHELLEVAARSIPSQAELRKLPAEELHMTPKLLQLAGYQLGQVAEALEGNPALAADGMYFYEKCVLTEANPSSVRALCLSDYEKLAEKAHLPMRDNLAPSSIQELAEQIKNI